jgi:mannose-6-phosphate isomerase-like protein (cupin superfamily)
MNEEATSLRLHHVAAGQGPCICYAGLELAVKLDAHASGGESTVIEGVIPPDIGPPLHVHQKENETYYVLEGEFEFVCGDERVTGGAGTFVFGPRGVPHRYKNIGSTPGRVLFGFTPGGIEAFFEELGKQRELNPQLMTEIAARHGITFVAPRE